MAQKNKRAKLNHRSPTPIRDLGLNLKVSFIQAAVEEEVMPALKVIDEVLVNKPSYVYVCLSEYIPNDSVKKHRFVNMLESSGLSVSCILLTYLPGSNIGKMLFIWKVPGHEEFGEYLQQSQEVIEEIKKRLPVFHTRTMKATMFQKFGRITHGVKPAVLRHFYKELTGELF